MNLRVRFTPSRQKPAGSGPVDYCGCAMGAKFMGLALAGSTAWYVYQRHAHSLVGICGRVLLISFAAAVLGKIVGIVWYRLKHSRPSPKPSLRNAVDKRALAPLTSESSDAGMLISRTKVRKVPQKSS